MGIHPQHDHSLPTSTGEGWSSVPGSISRLSRARLGRSAYSCTQGRHRPGGGGMDSTLRVARHVSQAGRYTPSCAQEHGTHACACTTIHTSEPGLCFAGARDDHAHHAQQAQQAPAQRTSGPDLYSTPGSRRVRPAAGWPLGPPTTGPVPAACAGTAPGAAVVVVAVGAAEMPPPLMAAACCAWAAATAAPTVVGTGVGPVLGEACGDRSSCTCA